MNSYFSLNGKEGEIMVTHAPNGRKYDYSERCMQRIGEYICERDQKYERGELTDDDMIKDYKRVKIFAIIWSISEVAMAILFLFGLHEANIITLVLFWIFCYFVGLKYQFLVGINPDYDKAKELIAEREKNNGRGC